MTLQDYKTISELTAEHFGVFKKVDIKVKDVNRGGAWKYIGLDKYYIILPKWLEKYDDNYAIYYAVHEICHIIALIKNWDWSHGEMFKKIEDEALVLWGLEIERAKVYPKELYANGQQIKNILR